MYTVSLHKPPLLIDYLPLLAVFSAPDRRSEAFSSSFTSSTSALRSCYNVVIASTAWQSRPFRNRRAGGVSRHQHSRAVGMFVVAQHVRAAAIFRTTELLPASASSVPPSHCYLLHVPYVQHSPAAASSTVKLSPSSRRSIRRLQFQETAQ